MSDSSGGLIIGGGYEWPMGWCVGGWAILQRCDSNGNIFADSSGSPVNGAVITRLIRLRNQNNLVLHKFAMDDIGYTQFRCIKPNLDSLWRVQELLNHATVLDNNVICGIETNVWSGTNNLKYYDSTGTLLNILYVPQQLDSAVSGIKAARGFNFIYFGKNGAFAYLFDTVTIPGILLYTIQDLLPGRMIAGIEKRNANWFFAEAGKLFLPEWAAHRQRVPGPAGAPAGPYGPAPGAVRVARLLCPLPSGVARD